MTTTETCLSFPSSVARYTTTPDLLGHWAHAQRTVGDYCLPYATTNATARRKAMHDLAALSMDPYSSMDRDSDLDIWRFDRP